MAAKFEIQAPKAGEFRWVLVSQGRTLATSPAYASKAAAQNGMASFRRAAANAPVADLTLPAAKTPAGKVGRATGRALGQAVIKSGRAVEKVEEVAAKTTKATTEAVKTAAKAATASKRKGRAKKIG